MSVRTTCVGGVLVALLWALPAPAAAAAVGYGPYEAALVRVIDGDTVELDIALWPGLVQRVHLRLDGVDTPEKRSAAVCERILARRASEFTQHFFRVGAAVVVAGVRLGKYAGRVLGRIAVDGADLGEALLAAGLAHPYDGGRRGPWCE